MNPDKAAPEGAACTGHTLFSMKASEFKEQTKSWGHYGGGTNYQNG